MRAFIMILPMAGLLALFAQSPAASPGCEPRPEVRRILDEKLSEKTLDEMRFTERVAFRRQVLEDLIAQYPREVEPYRRLIQDPGVVAPFMTEKGYTFPALPAYNFVTGLIDQVAIPQNWIVDAKGEWRWTGAPGAPDAQWEDAMLKQLESAR